MVKKNSKLLGRTVVDEQDSSDVEMDQRFWHDVLDLYFFRSKESRRKQDDDLVFLVRKLVQVLLRYFCCVFLFLLRVMYVNSYVLNCSSTGFSGKWF